MGIRNAVLAAASPAVLAQTEQTKEKRPPAQFYINIGFETDDPKFPFVDLNKSGIPLDYVPDHDIRGEITEWKQFAAMQQALKAAFQDRANQLAPGETAIVARDEETGICVQIRRVANKEEQPVLTAEIKGISFR